jgi:hypothetical protein
MAIKERRGAGKYDRRVQIYKPTTIANAVNQKLAGPPELVYDKFPAHRKENARQIEESVQNNSSRSALIVEWELRFIPGLDIKTDWMIKDIFSSKSYKVISPSAEIGRREGILVRTEILE